jgi:hypothetical protein
MLSLRTGLPGQGKTLSVVNQLHSLNQEFPEGFKRPIYVCGIDSLKAELLPNLTIIFIDYEALNDWQNFEESAIVIVDEAQKWAPQRSAKVKAPEHITALSEHRHKGFDFWFVTQDPRLLDAWIRRLINEHIHVRRLFNTNWQVSYKWEKCVDDPKDRREIKYSTKKFTRLKKEVFHLYKSSVDHNMTGKMPLSFKLLIVFVIFFIAAVIYAFSTGGGLTDEPEPVTHEPTPVFQIEQKPKMELIEVSSVFPIKYCRRAGKVKNQHYIELVFIEGDTYLASIQELKNQGFNFIFKNNQYYCENFLTLDRHPMQKTTGSRTVTNQTRNLF